MHSYDPRQQFIDGLERYVSGIELGASLRERLKRQPRSCPPFTKSRPREQPSAQEISEERDAGDPI